MWLLRNVLVVVKTIKLLVVFILMAVFNSTQVLADGTVIDKVYHPYVMSNESEFEWRFLSRQTEEGHNLLTQRIAYGQSVAENIMLEFYVIGDRDEFDDFSLEAYEIEARWMLTEPGEYWADWAILGEIEKHHKFNNWEVTGGVLVEKEFGHTSLTLNMFVIYEWGETLADEIETEFRLKYRYRWLPELQPAIEVYIGEDYSGIGPAFMGIHRFSGQKQLKWELAFITGINKGGKDHSLRFAVEYEF